MGAHADIIIVGGGTIGCACAYYLSGKGQRVTVLERDDTASGTAGASGSLISWFAAEPGYRTDLVLESRVLFQTLEEELGRKFGRRMEAGTLQAVASETERELIQKTMEANRRPGYDVYLLTIDEARRIEPVMSPDLLGAVYVPQADFVDPIQLALAYRAAAIRQGADFRNGVEVTGFVTGGGRVTGVATSQGELSAGLVINCAGVWAGELAKTLDLEIPVVPRRGQMLVTEPVAPLCRSMITSSMYQTVLFHPELIEDERVKKYGYSFAVEQTDTGTCIIYSTREFAGFDTGTSTQVIEMLAQEACKIVPRLRDLHIIRTFAGLRPWTPDDNPVIGPVDSCPGLFLCSGHEGEGITLAPITGKLVAEWVVDGSPSFDLSPLTPNRFVKV